MGDKKAGPAGPAFFYFAQAMRNRGHMISIIQFGSQFLQIHTG